MYGIFPNICPKNHPNVGKYAIHGAYGQVCLSMLTMFTQKGLTKSQRISASRYLQILKEQERKEL